MVTRQVLSQHHAELNLKELYTGSTGNVFKSVMMGKIPAGVTLDADLDRETPEIKSQLRTIMQTKPLAPHPVSAHPRVAKSLREQLATTLLKLAKEPQGLELLKKVRIGETFRADYARDYRELESVNYETLTKGK